MVEQRKIDKNVSLSITALSIPIFIELFLQLSLGNIDQFMMSQYSQESVAAVANANQIINVVIMLITVMSTATTILVAQYLGAKDTSKIAEVCTVSIFFNAVFSIIAGLGIIFFHEKLFLWLEVPPELMEDTSLYAMIVAAGIPLQAIYLAMAATFRGHSWPKITMYIALVMNIIHIGSNFIFIFGVGPIPPLGVLGVSISTNLSKAVGLLIITYIFRNYLKVPTSWKYLRPFPWSTLKQILHISVPSGGETLSYQLSQTTIMKMVNIFGLAVITTKVYVYIIAMCCYVYTIAMANASQIIVGFLIGADKEEDVSGRVWHTVKMAILINVSLCILFYLGSDYVFGLFTDNPEVLALGKAVLFVEIFLEIGRAVNIVMVNCLQAAGDIRTPMLVGIFGMWVFAVNLSYLFGIRWGWGLVGIWIAMAIDECIRAAIFVYRWKSGKWKNHKLINITA